MDSGGEEGEVGLLGGAHGACATAGVGGGVSGGGFMVAGGGGRGVVVVVLVVVVGGGVLVGKEVGGPDGPVGELRDIGGGEEGGFAESCDVELFEGVFAVGVRVENGGGGWELRG